MAHKAIELQALDALLWDGHRPLNVAPSVAHQHAFLCHADGSVCDDGCDVSADPVRVAALAFAAYVLLPVARRDPFQNGEHTTLPVWYVARRI